MPDRSAYCGAGAKGINSSLVRRRTRSKARCRTLTSRFRTGVSRGSNVFQMRLGKMCLIAAHPVRVVHQRADHLLVQTSCRTKVDIFHAGRTLQPPISEPPLQRPVLSPVPLAVHQQGKSSSKLSWVASGSSCCWVKASALPRMRMVYSYSIVCWLSMVLLVCLLNHWRLGLRWGIEVIGAADVFVVDRRLNGRIARQRHRSSWYFRIESMLWQL